MPAMPKFEDLAHSHGIPGHFGVHPTFAHGGEYRLRLRLLPPGEVSPWTAVSVEFALEVKDSTPNRPVRPRPFELQLTTTPASPKAGEAVTPELGVRMVNTVDGRLAREFDTAHEKLVHVFLVRTDFGQFAHVHPELSDDGRFRLSHNFSAGGVYRVFVDVAPKGAGSQILRADLIVGGEPGSQWNIYEASKSEPGLKQRLADMALEWKLPSAVLPTGKTIVMTAQFEDAAGKPIRDIEPYLGAMGHLLLINQDTQTFVHSHPDDRTANPPGSIPFLARFPKPGLYRGWLQVQRKGEVRTSAFIVQAE